MRNNQTNYCYRVCQKTWPMDAMNVCLCAVGIIKGEQLNRGISMDETAKRKVIGNNPLIDQSDRYTDHD